MLVFALIVSLLPTKAADVDDEVRRIQGRLGLVEELLRSRDVSWMSPDLRAERLKNLARLRAYWQAGRFPQNPRQAGPRVPFFIDAAGTPCAVGHLMIESGAAAVAHRIARTDNNVYADRIVEAAFIEWARRSGLTPEELALIQPTYAPAKPTAVEKAIDRQDLHAIALLISSRITADVVLATAILKDKPKVVAWALRNGARIDRKERMVEVMIAGRMGSTSRREFGRPLQIALTYVHRREIAEQLLEAGARVDFPVSIMDAHGDLPSILYYQVHALARPHEDRGERYKNIRMLVKRGANLNIRSKKPDNPAVRGVDSVKSGTVLDLAICRGDQETIKFLRKLGAKATGAGERCAKQR